MLVLSLSKYLIRAVTDQNHCMDIGHNRQTLADYSTRQGRHVRFYWNRN